MVKAQTSSQLITQVGNAQQDTEKRLMDKKEASRWPYIIIVQRVKILQGSKPREDFGWGSFIRATALPDHINSLVWSQKTVIGFSRNFLASPGDLSEFRTEHLWKIKPFPDAASISSPYGKLLTDMKPSQQKRMLEECAARNNLFIEALAYNHNRNSIYRVQLKGKEGIRETMGIMLPFTIRGQALQHSDHSHWLSTPMDECKEALMDIRKLISR